MYDISLFRIIIIFFLLMIFVDLLLPLYEYRSCLYFVFWFSLFPYILEYLANYIFIISISKNGCKLPTAYQFVSNAIISLNKDFVFFFSFNSIRSFVCNFVLPFFFFRLIFLFCACFVNTNYSYCLYVMNCKTVC